MIIYQKYVCGYEIFGCPKWVNRARFLLRGVARQIVIEWIFKNKQVGWIR